MKSKATAYILWCAWLLGFGGIHRIYCGKYLSGIIWLFTWGLLGFGQVVDLALIPGMVDERNLKNIMLRGGNTNTQNQTVVVNVGEAIAPQAKASPLVSKSDTQLILELAKNNGGTLTLSDCIIATGKPTSQVKELVGNLCADGVLEIDNHPTSGAVVYKLL